MTQTRAVSSQFDRPPSRPIPVAPEGTPNTLVLSGIGLSTLCGKPGKWSFTGIGGAYVMCRQETHLGGVISGTRWVRYGRTTWPGWVVELEEDELDRPVPTTRESNYQFIARSDLMLLLPDERYVLFYSCDREHFMDVKSRVAAGEIQLEQVPGAIVFEFTRLEPQNLDELDLIPWLIENKHLDEQCRDILATHLLNSARGYVKRDTTLAPVACIDVTPATLKGLFRVEFLQWYALMAAKRSGEDLVALHRACSLIAASESGARDAVMEEEVEHKYAKSGTPEREMFERYRIYAWKCAAARVPRKDFTDTLPTLVGQVMARQSEDPRTPSERPDLEWQDLAMAMRVDTAQGPAGAAEHPGLDDAILSAAEPERGDLRARVLLSSQLGLRLVTGYFELYTLGARLKNKSIEGRGALLAPLVNDFDAEWEANRNRNLPRACCALLENIDYLELLVALGQHTGRDAHRLELFERYLDACAWVEHPWWGRLSAPSGEKEEELWKHLAPAAKWLSQALKSAGKTLSGLVETRVNAYSLAFTEAHELLQSLFRHEIVLSGTTVDPSIHYLERVTGEPGRPPNFRALVNLRNGEMTVTRDVPLPDAPHARVTFNLMRRVGPEAREFRIGPGQNAHALQLARNIRRLYSVELVVPADLAELKRRHTLLPKGFVACAELLNIAQAAATIATSMMEGADAKEQLIPTWELVKGVVALVETQQAALKAMARPLSVSSLAKQQLGGLKLAAAVVGGLDGAWRIYKGATILCSDEGDVEYEMRQGRSMRAFLQASKGVLQIAGGTVGILAALPATAALAATPVGLLIAIGAGLVAATLDVALDATQEFQDHVSEFERALDRAQRVELGARCFRASATVLAACDATKKAV